jgi:hypothetical protein
MNKGLRSSIDEWGGKHGPLLYIREQLPDGETLVPPFELANLSELASKRDVPDLCRRIRAACLDMGVTEFIARTSYPGIPGDWDKMVDVIESIARIPIHLLDGSNFPTGIARSLFEQCKDPRVISYAEGEGIDYDPSKVTISFTPQLPLPHSTITDHPNRPELLMMDLSQPIGGSGAGRSLHNMSESDAVNFEYGSRVTIPTLFDPHLFDAAYGTRLRLRELGILDEDDMAYQLEGAFDLSKRHWLVQIRAFSERREADFSLDKGDRTFGRQRLMGVTPKEGLELTYLKGRERKEAMKFEKTHPGEAYLFDLNRDASTPRLAITDDPMHMAGYAVQSKPYISHQATRFAQRCLRAGGIVNLHAGSSSLVYRRMGLETGDRIRVFSDGNKQHVERV